MYVMGCLKPISTFCQSVFTQNMVLRVRILGAFAKLRKAAISFMSVCLSVWNNSAPSGRILMKLDI
jgi:hypothetical protein